MDILFTSQNYFIPLLEVILSMVLGGFIGAERSIAGKTAGMRTYSLVAVGATLFVIVSQFLPADIHGDILRFPSAIITGIGFLGAGLIVFREHKDSISGLTTAAGLWVAAGIGVAVGFGLYVFAIWTTLITLFIFTIMWDIEQKLIKMAEERKVYSEDEIARNRM